MVRPRAVNSVTVVRFHPGQPNPLRVAQRPVLPPDERATVVRLHPRRPYFRRVAKLGLQLVYTQSRGRFDSGPADQVIVPVFRLWASLPPFSAECPGVRVPSPVPHVSTALRWQAHLAGPSSLRRGFESRRRHQVLGHGRKVRHLFREQGIGWVRFPLPQPTTPETGLPVGAGLRPTLGRVDDCRPRTGRPVAVT